MGGHFLKESYISPAEHNIYSDKSSLILDWILRLGLEKESFSLREIARFLNVSIGLTHTVLKQLVMDGVLQSTGERTSKSFKVLNHNRLIINWLNCYNVVKKCRMRTYDTGLSSNNELFQMLIKNRLNQKCVLALHSSAEALGYKNTNIKSLELYLLDPALRNEVEHTLELEPKERGYKVLLIDPYYKGLIKSSVPLMKNRGEWIKMQEYNDECLMAAPEMLTFLDLYHFPLRGIEQAEYMAQRINYLKKFMLYKESHR